MVNTDSPADSSKMDRVNDGSEDQEDSSSETSEENNGVEKEAHQEFLREQRFQFSRIVSATRLHLPADAEEIPEATAEHLRRYVSQAQALGVVTAIAVNGHVDQVRAICKETEPEAHVEVLHVPCWGAFVAALNALLNFAQRYGAKYILFQSLEVCCHRDVLQRLLDFQTPDTLVVGPVCDGHSFQPGEQPLHGRSSPWNTLALWSVRKLALTGFLCIADGLTGSSPSLGRRAGKEFLAAQDQNPQDSLDPAGPMGSDDWWNNGFGRQQSSVPTESIPAGVEEVTAIALLQHLHGADRSQALLLKLQPYLEAKMSWTASWGHDERRKKWHAYKMASKVSRPAAQLQELFKFKKNTSSASMSTDVDDKSEGGLLRSASGFLRRRKPDIAKSSQDNKDTTDGMSPTSAPKETDINDPHHHAGVVLHYGESIPPLRRVMQICLAMCLLFYANSTIVLANAFRHLNDHGPNQQPSAQEVAFVALLIGGVYLPMPLSLWIIRNVARTYDHKLGFLLFLFFLLFGHVISCMGQVLQSCAWWPLLLGRFVEGLGSGVLFQSRHILAITSTSDQHVDLQAWNFLMSDLGLGFGALFPALVNRLLPATPLTVKAPELLPSVLFIIIVIFAGVWVILRFPRRLICLPDRVRFVEGKREKNRRHTLTEDDARHFQYITWLSGTTRIFVQSAVLPVIALSMRDAKWTGNYRQTCAVAAICLVPLPFEVFASHLSCSCAVRSSAASDDHTLSKLVSGAIGAVTLLIAGLQPRSGPTEDGEFVTLITRLCELGILMIALALAAPFNASRLYKQKGAERSIVILEWLKAYVGRLLGPFFAVLLYSYAGYGTVLALLSMATALVTLTA